MIGGFMGMENLGTAYDWIPFSGVSFSGATTLIIGAALLVAIILVVWKLKLYKFVMPFPIRAVILERHGNDIVLKKDFIRLIENKQGEKLHQFKYRDLEIPPIPTNQFAAPFLVILYAKDRTTMIPLAINEAQGLLSPHYVSEETMNAMIRRFEKNVLRFTKDDWTKYLPYIMILVTLLVVGVVYVMIGDSLQKVSGQLAGATMAQAQATQQIVDYLNSTGYRPKNITQSENPDINIPFIR